MLAVLVIAYVQTMSERYNNATRTLHRIARSRLMVALEYTYAFPSREMRGSQKARKTKVEARADDCIVTPERCKYVCLDSHETPSCRVDLRAIVGIW